MRKQSMLSPWTYSLPNMKVRIVSIAILLGCLTLLFIFAYCTTPSQAIETEYNANEKTIFPTKSSSFVQDAKKTYPSDGWTLDSPFNEKDYIAMSTFGYCQRIGFINFSKDFYNIKEDILYILQEIVPIEKERLDNRENGVSLKGVLDFDESNLRLSFCVKNAGSSKEANDMFEEAFCVINEDFEELLEKRYEELGI